MSAVAGEHELARRYLLGDLSEREGETFEERFFAEDDLYELVRAAETDLLDEYVRGELDERERSAFARRLAASPELHERLAGARAIARRFESPAADGPGVDPRFASTRRRVPPYLAAAAAVLGGIVLVRIALESQSLKSELRSSRSARERLEAENRSLRDEARSSHPAVAPATPVASAPIEIASGAAVSLRLAPGLLRDMAGRNDFRVPAGASATLLEVPLEGGSKVTYTATIETPEGDRLLEQRRLEPVLRGKTPVVVVGTSPRGLPPGDYLLKIKPESAATRANEASFAFRVTYR